jgi:hypothetical protein
MEEIRLSAPAPGKQVLVFNVEKNPGHRVVADLAEKVKVRENAP